MAAITVIGAGYVGLVSSACFASLGHNVRCVEPDSDRLSRLLDGEMPIYEPGLGELVEQASADRSLRFTGAVEESLAGSKFAFMAVPTPPKPEGGSDLSAVLSVAGQIKDHADDGTVVVIKSTVPVGTGDKIASELEGRFPVVSNPEFLREGTAVKDFLEPIRVVIGADDEAAARGVADLYSPIDAPVITIDRRSAELAKYASNSYLAVRLSFANEVARISEATGADIDSVTRVMAMDPRIGPHYLRTGIGWGGSCLPKDVDALADTSLASGVEPHMLKAAKAANAAQVDFLVSTLDRALGGLEGKVIGMLGSAFKAGTDDVRESQAIAAAKRLMAAGATVRAHDPIALENTAKVAPELNLVTSVSELAVGADAVVLSVDWPEYRDLDWATISESIRGRVVFDACNALDAESVTSAGLKYTSYGRRRPGGDL